MDRRLITPAEAALLLSPSSTTANECLQAALLCLISARRIVIEPSSSMFKRSGLRIMPPPTTTETELPAHLIAVEQALQNYGKGNRLDSAEVLHALQKRFGYGFGRYVHDHVALGLAKRKLLTRKDSKWLGLFPRITYERTASGDALSGPIERLMLAVEQLPSLIDRDPDQALRIARSAGVLLIMSPKARRQIPELRKLLAERGDEIVPLTYMATNDEGDGRLELEQILDLGDMALAFEVDALFDGIDAVGDFTSGADSSSSDSGDGGGDGGGGGD